jgi:hypothetical protein
VVAAKIALKENRVTSRIHDHDKRVGRSLTAQLAAGIRPIS